MTHVFAFKKHITFEVHNTLSSLLKTLMFEYTFHSQLAAAAAAAAKTNGAVMLTHVVKWKEGRCFFSARLLSKAARWLHPFFR